MTVVESSEAESQADDASQPQAGTSHESQADPEPISLDEARKLRNEAANLRRRLKERDAELEQHRSAGLSELERLQRENAALKQAQTDAIRERQERAVERLLSSAQAQYPDLLLSKVDPTELEIDPDGSIANGPALVSRLKKQYPGLFRVPSADAGASGTPDAGSDINAFIRRQAGR